MTDTTKRLAEIKEKADADPVTVARMVDLIEALMERGEHVCECAKDTMAAIDQRAPDRKTVPLYRSIRRFKDATDLYKKLFTEEP